MYEEDNDFKWWYIFSKRKSDRPSNLGSILVLVLISVASLILGLSEYRAKNDDATATFCFSGSCFVLALFYCLYLILSMKKSSKLK